MSLANWLRIIAEIIKLIADGLPKDQAVSQVARKFGVSESEIWKKGGF